MTDSSNKLHAYVDSDRLYNPVAFSRQRRTILSRGDEDRSAELADLLRETPTVEGNSLLDLTLDQITAANAVEDAAARLARVQRTAKRIIEVAFTEAGTVSGVFEREILPLDDEAMARQRALADRVGYGPKQNNASFRIGSGR